MLFSKSAVYNNKKSRFIKEQEASELLIQLGIRRPLSKIPLLGDFLLKMYNIINKFLLAGDRFMPEMHLWKPGFMCSVCRPFTKTKKEYK